MPADTPAIPIRKYLLLSLCVFAAFSVPALAALVLLGLLPLGAALFLFAIFALSGIPSTGILAGYASRLDPPSGPPVSLMATCAIPAQLFLFLAGALIGKELSYPAGALVGAVAGFLLGKLLGFRLARFLWPRLVKVPQAPPPTT